MCLLIWLVIDIFLPCVPVSTAAEPWPENATLYQQLKGRCLFSIKNGFISKYVCSVMSDSL